MVYIFDDISCNLLVHYVRPSVFRILESPGHFISWRLDLNYKPLYSLLGHNNNGYGLLRKGCASNEKLYFENKDVCKERQIFSMFQCCKCLCIHIFLCRQAVKRCGLSFVISIIDISKWS